MERLTGKNRILVGLTLFSMFFGAGNLIFPPYLGAMAGQSAWTAMAGFALTAVGFPILGVIAVARSGGLTALASRVHPGFAFVFTLLIYLSIGPCLAIPRTASTSFEMAVKPFLAGNAPGVLTTARAAYSAVFFGIAFLVALRPEKLTKRLGRVLTPCLLTLIAVLFIGCLVRPAGGYGTALEPYASSPFSTGFLEGYQTMDTIAALNFGLIIAMNIRAMGVSSEKHVVEETVRAGLAAGAVLLAVYCALAHTGAVAGGSFSGLENGAQTLTALARGLFGDAGAVLLGVIFFIACLNTCIGLLSCCSNYFCTILPRPGYVGWVAVFALVSMVVSNVGLNKILEISVPVLNMIYPAAIVLIVLALCRRLIGDHRAVYRCAVAAAGVFSVVSVLAKSGLRIPVFAAVSERMPWDGIGLGWCAPALAGIVLGMILAAAGIGRGQREKEE